MQEKSSKKLSPVQRLENLHLQTGFTWDEIAKQMEVSSGMLHQVRAGKKNLGPRKLFLLNKAELAAGIDQCSEVEADYPEPRSGAAVVRDSEDQVATRLGALENGMLECKNVCEKTNELLMTIQNTLLQLLAAGRGGADKGVGDSAERKAG